jgi:capsular exopolysaccharide synthesis family protein
MSILKPLQKRHVENSDGVPQPRPRNIVPFEKNGRLSNALPELLSADDLRIGNPGSAFIGQPVSTIGTALPDLETDLTAGATLNAGNLTRVGARQLPDFVSWTVDAERVEPRLVSITQPHSRYCEEYRSLRTHVMHKSQQRHLQAIVVASVNPGEGKSVTAINLSWLLAQTDGVKALAIDSDLRTPSIADYLGIETDKGLSHILDGTATLAESIVRIEPTGLHLLPGGEARPDVAELISGPKFHDILRQAREMFDYIIIDAPPLGIFTDATVLINHADAAIVVVKANTTRYGMLERILEPLPRERLLGVVMNQAEPLLDENTYPYGRYNYQRLNELPIRDELPSP